jgi:serine/threonine protein kinase
VPTPAPDEDGQEVGTYTLGRQIGHGGFSIVKEAFTIENGESVVHAVKIVRKRAAEDELENENLQHHFEHEIAVWRCLSNRHILPLLSVIETPYAFWAFTLLVTGGTLYDALKIHRRGLAPYLSLRYSFQLASALRYLHQDARVVHRDVKLENCVLDRPGGDLLLCDFGLADFLQGDDTPSPRQQYITPLSNGENQHCINPEDMVAGGSLAFAAPEQINSTAPLLLTAMDMWSYGIVVHALTAGQLPFTHGYAPRLQMMITKGVWDVERFVRRVDSEVAEVVIHCLEMDYDRRWTAEDVLKSAWISSYVETDGNDP